MVHDETLLQIMERRNINNDDAAIVAFLIKVHVKGLWAYRMVRRLF